MGTKENTFGILAAKWRTFCRPITAGIEQIEGLTRAAVYLHNCIRLTDNANYLPKGFVGSWIQQEKSFLVIGEVL